MKIFLMQIYIYTQYLYNDHNYMKKIVLFYALNYYRVNTPVIDYNII